MNKDFLYKGYFPTANKKPSIKGWNKGNAFKTIESVLSTYRGYDIGGLIADNIVYIDIDQHGTKDNEARNYEAFLSIIKDEGLKCIVRETTSGVHCFFRDTHSRITKNTEGQLACGITAEIKKGNSWEPIIYNSKERKIIIGEDVNSLEDLDELPAYFWPIPAKCEEDLFISEGVRNNTFFRYAMNLYANKIFTDKEAIRDVIKIANKYLFESPVEESEIDTSLSDDQFEKYGSTTRKYSKRSDDTNTVNWKEIATEILTKFHVKNYDGKLYYYIDGYYQSEDNAENAILHEYLDMFKTRNNEMDVLYFLRRIAPKATPASPDFILFKNLVLNIKTGQKLDLSSEYFILNRIPHAYNDEATSPIVDKFLNDISCHNDSVRAILEELAGECLYSSYEHSKVFFLTGNGSNGKTTFIEFLRYVIGENNCSSSTIEQIVSRFGQTDLKDKLANITDEIPRNLTIRTDLIKSLSGNSMISGELKGFNGKIQFRNYATLVFSGNTLPHMQINKAERRRFVLVPFKASFDKTKKDTAFIDKLCTEECAEYMIRLALQGLRRVFDNNGELTVCDTSQKALEAYEMENNTVYGFFMTVGIDAIINHTLEDVLNAYLMYCEENDFIATHKLSMSKNLRNHLHITLKVCTGNQRRFVPAEGYTGKWEDD